MGQYWRLINLDKRQAFENWGKLGQYLFSSDPERILPYLILPSLSEVRYLDDSSRERFLQAIKAVSWAGDRIICIGDYIEDYPPDMLSDIEEKETQELISFDTLDGEFTRKQELWGVVNSKYTPPIEIQPYLKFIDFKISTSWVLRNLSKHTYVRAEVVALDPDFIDGPWIKYFGFGHIVLSFINWSSDDSRASRCSADVTKGAWAGNRFDIASIDALHTSKEQWRDVSESVVETAKSYFKAEYEWNGYDGLLDGLKDHT
jgi:hypothetical protein